MTIEQVEEFCRMHVPKNPASVQVRNQRFWTDLEALLYFTGFEERGLISGTYSKRDETCASILFCEDVFEEYDFEQQRYVPTHSFSLVQLLPEQMFGFYASRIHLSHIVKDEREIQRELSDCNKDNKLRYRGTGINYYAVGGVIGFVLGTAAMALLQEYELNDVYNAGIIMVGVLIGAGAARILGDKKIKKEAEKIRTSNAQPQSQYQQKIAELRTQYKEKYKQFIDAYKPFILFDKQAIEAVHEYSLLHRESK